MQNRWSVLSLLFVIRVTMAFQFQAVAAMSPLFMESFGVNLADIGLLIGLYLAPGIIIAMPGGALGARFGDRKVVAIGLFLMVCGGLAMAIGSHWYMQLLGRLLAGVGGVLLNVLMSKMVTDWFAGREIGTAMGIFVNSWPVGIALSLLVLPIVADVAGLQVALFSVVIFAVFGLLLLYAYKEPATDNISDTQTSGLTGTPLLAVIIAGSIWGLYNAALGMIFGFAPAMLTSDGWSLATASFATSIVLWLVAISVPLGGIIADRTGRRDTVLLFGLISFAIFLTIAPQTDWVIATFAVLGLVGGIAAGPIMSLPSAVLSPQTRSQGMGVYFTLFYLGVVIAPMIAGWLSEKTHNAGAAFFFGAFMLALASAALFAFKLLEARLKRDAK
ncbi:MAG: MFS transporter [Hyphomicrobiales bacterium]